jgi:Lrp/AsnC family transcriptional regulator for asnA, asnC and gidA
MIDEIDQKLILELQEDGRQSYIELAKKLSVTEGTVRRRLKSLKNRKIIKVSAVPSVAELGYKFIAIVAIQVNMAYVNTVAEELSKNRAICQVSFVTGRYDLIAMVATRSTDEFSKFMREELSVIPHVVRTETFIVLSTIKGLFGLPDTRQLVRDAEVSSPKNKRKQMRSEEGY